MMTKRQQHHHELFAVPQKLSLSVSPKLNAVFECRESQKCEFTALCGGAAEEEAMLFPCSSDIQWERHFSSEVYLIALAASAAWEDLSTWLLPAEVVL